MIVLDCNAAIAMIRNTPEGKALRTLLLDDEEVYAPRFFCVETAQTVSKYVCANLVEREEAGIFFSSVINLVDDFYDDEDLIEEAISESIRLDHSVYDLLYFVLARRHMATLFTLDKSLQELCLNNGVNCVFLDTEVSVLDELHRFENVPMPDKEDFPDLSGDELTEAIRKTHYGY